MSSVKDGHLLVSEAFHSVQGEGITSGYPAYFVRLANCNLSCGASVEFVNKFKKDEVSYDPGSFKGDLHASNEATWTCDTIPVWAKGKERSYQWLIDKWKDEGVYEDIKKGLIHIIWTGGEPTDQLTDEIVRFFGKKGYYQAIETSGLNPVPAGIDFVCVSPKVAEHIIAKNFPNGVTELRYVRHKGQSIP